MQDVHFKNNITQLRRHIRMYVIKRPFHDYLEVGHITFVSQNDLIISLLNFTEPLVAPYKSLTMIMTSF